MADDEKTKTISEKESSNMLNKPTFEMVSKQLGDNNNEIEIQDKNGKTLHLKEVHVRCNSLFPYDSGKKTK